MSTKRYGLIIKKKNKDSQVKKSSVFGNDSSEEEEEKVKKGINVTLMREAEKKKQMKQTQIEIEKALKEDPTVYEYDNIYDDMSKKKEAAIPKLAEKDKKPKYIQNLLKSAKARKMEEERRIERKTHKEREEEGGEFRDKEEFVTSAYRKRMLELEEEEKQLRRQDQIDAMNDVTKRSDLSMFYSNLLKHNVSMGGAFSADVKSETQESRIDKNEDKGDGASTEKSEKVKSKQTHDTRTREENSRQLSKDDEHPRDSRNERDNRTRHRDDSDKHSRDHERRRRDSSEDRHYQKRKDHDRERDRGESRRETDRYSESSRKSDSHRKHDRQDAEERLTSERSLEQKDEENRKLKDTKKEATSEKIKQEDGAQSKFAKRSNSETISSAKQRYLERKRAREIALQQRKRNDSDED